MDLILHISSFKFIFRLCILLSLLIPVSVILFYSEAFFKDNLAEDEIRSYRARYKEIFHHDVGAKILILGSSNSAHGIVPSLLNLQKPTYNFSFNGASGQFTRDLYIKYLRPSYPKPEYILYAVSPGSFQKTLWRKIDEDVRYLPEHKESIVKQLRGLKVLNVNCIMETLIKEFSLIGVPRLGMDMRKYDNGFLPYSNGKAYKPLQELSFDIDPVQVAAVASLFNDLKQSGIKVIVLILPSPDGQYRQGDLNSFNKTVVSLAAGIKAQVIKADDVAPSFGKNFSLFNDDVHLTEEGAQIFSIRVGLFLSRQLINAS